MRSTTFDGACKEFSPTTSILAPDGFNVSSDGRSTLSYLVQDTRAPRISPDERRGRRNATSTQDEDHP